jgi:CHAD domain-containing protein
MQKPVPTSLAAFKHLLAELLDVLEANEAGVMDNRDVECLHDFRVALRKMRTTTGQIREIYAPQVLEPVRQELAWLAALTTPVRDLDVYLAEFAELAASLPEEMRDDLAPFKSFLQSRHHQARAALTAGLAAERYAHFKRDLRALLEREDDPASLVANALRPVDELARELIWARYEKLLHQAKGVKSKSPDEAFHRVRKSAKKLRYLMEFFQDQFAEKGLRVLLKDLKAIQDKLGEIQDLHVQITILQEYAESVAHKEGGSAAALLASGALQENLLQQKLAARMAFRKRFKAFDKHKVRKRFKKLFLH